MSNPYNRTYHLYTLKDDGSIGDHLDSWACENPVTGEPVLDVADRLASEHGSIVVVMLCQPGHGPIDCGIRHPVPYALARKAKKAGLT